MLYLGLDLSLTGSGVVCIDDSYEIQHQTKFSTPQVGVERLIFLEHMLQKFLEDYAGLIQGVAIEAPAFGSGRNGGHLFDIGEWNGLVKTQLFKKGLKFITPVPMQVKKYVIGKGTSAGKKELIMLDIYKKYGVEIRDNDIADAYVLARIARDYWCGEESIPSYQQEVLKALRKSAKEQTIGQVLV